MRKLDYKITALSSTIVSPRGGQAFYVDDNLNGKYEEEYPDRGKVKLVYPFYQYGEYESYRPAKAEYYLPGSAIKGAICCGKMDGRGLMVDDIPIKNESIVLRNLYKAQYVKEESVVQNACFGIFFENVGVEMLRAKTQMEGELYAKKRATVESVLEDANALTNKKIKQMLCYLNTIKGYAGLSVVLKDVINKLTLLSNSKDVILLGGYKGLLHSIELQKADEVIQSAIFIDRETSLPHGLAKIELL